MKTIADFEDLLILFHRYEVRYLIIGGLAFIYHAKPRFTKDMDLWVENTPGNIERANRALAAFGSPTLLDNDDSDQIVQIGLAPHRIDLLVDVKSVRFIETWPKRIESEYGNAPAYWIDLDSLEKIKSAINDPRHQEDARILRKVRKLRNQA